MPANRFACSDDLLHALADDALRMAQRKGATAFEVDVSERFGQTVTVRQSKLETIEYTRDKSLSVTAYLGLHRGHASSSDFSPKAIEDTIEAALNIARFTSEDPYVGLADAALMARDIPDLQLYHPHPVSVEQATELAHACEQAAFATDKRVSNSEGATFSSHASHFATANSQGFTGAYPSSHYSLSCSVIAGAGEGMQRDYWFGTHRDFHRLETPEEIGRTCAERTVARLGSRRVKTMEVPVIFQAHLATGLIGSLVQAVSGSALYRKSSFLLDSLGQQIFPGFVNLSERPHLPAAMGSSPFDQEGVATRDREVLVDGVLQGYFLNTYAGRKLGMPTTGNAGGSHNLVLQPGKDDLPALIRRMGRGLLVTELLGHGINYVTGDYSRGAAGFWVEKGEIAYPVEEITIAGNLREMFMNIVAIGSDVYNKGAKHTGSILIERMQVAGD